MEQVYPGATYFEECYRQRALNDRPDLPNHWAKFRRPNRLTHSNHENGGACGFSSRQVPMCLHRVLQGIPLIDLDVDAACRHMAE
ncbi:hypothetical protein SBC2_52460 (plasmid) [Caballeronia sp. SBC2]|nr:hypothetical protein SBC2_52460 [Caballeronia sp. SBC2]